MTLRELHYLVALADLGHFGRAAQACHVSQPTLSTQLKKLEESLGVVLFERTNKTLHITPIGEQIVSKARWVLEEAESIVSLARRRSGPLTGPLDLGVIPTLGPYLLPWLLPPLESAFPEMRLVVHEDLTDRLLDQLKAHQIDAALLALPVDDRELNVLPIFDEPFRLVLPPGHRLIGTAAVAQSELHREHLLLLSEGHCFRDQALAVCGPEPSRVENQGTDIRAASLETICRMVAAGMGCTLLPAMALTGAGHYDFEVCPWMRRAPDGSAWSGGRPFREPWTWSTSRRRFATICHRRSGRSEVFPASLRRRGSLPHRPGRRSRKAGRRPSHTAPDHSNFELF